VTLQQIFDGLDGLEREHGIRFYCIVVIPGEDGPTIKAHRSPGDAYELIDKIMLVEGRKSPKP
jgi:hypothetical protein